MNKATVVRLQDEAEQAYERLPQPEAAHNAQVVMLAEIALQLGRQTEELQRIASALEGLQAMAEASGDK